MINRITLPFALLLLLIANSAAVKPSNPGIVVLGIRATTFELSDGSSAVKVTEVFSDSPARRLFEQPKSRPISKPYIFYQLEPGDIIFQIGVDGATPADPLTFTKVNNVQDLKLGLYRNHGKIVTLKVKVPVTQSNNSGTQDFRVKLNRLPI